MGIIPYYRITKNPDELSVSPELRGDTRKSQRQSQKDLFVSPKFWGYRKVRAGIFNQKGGQPTSGLGAYISLNLC